MNLIQSPVAVIGAGTMGSGIATVAARGGYDTVVYDVSEQGLTRGLDTIRSFFEKSRDLGKLTAEEASAANARVRGTTDITDLATAGVVIEAVFEDLAVKKELMGQVESIVAADTLLHTNTSTLSVTAIASGLKHPDRLVGTHYCNPAPLLSLVEVADGRHTATSARETCIEFLRSVGKTTVVTKDRPGFIVNRFLIPWENSCIQALDSGLGTIESIDTAVTGALGHPMGPFRLLDIVGLDIHQQVATRLYEQLRDPRFFPPPMVERMVSAGDLGRKTGRGFYEYDNTRLFGS
ncbi:3-hydroxyacyl-CoA dehydrogenase family protein [Rhodococcus opacus]|uniref:3-hydroxyacyl-CoA dehydrogenase family protein n=1 Tax=Rhodococcus opacus TaxID=37919 RepID=UPI0006BB469E|nr:3-hydroxyacyl-CoA dehydrogenase family protein [Rhodococcus opacus]